MNNAQTKYKSVGVRLLIFLVRARVSYLFIHTIGAARCADKNRKTQKDEDNEIRDRRSSIY